MTRREPTAGQALVEFALLAALVVTLLLGIVDFGRAYYTQVQIKNAVGDAGYFAIQNPDDNNGAKDMIARQLSNLNPPINKTTQIAITCASGSTKKQISVTYQYHLMFSWLVPSAQVTLGDETFVPQLEAC